jgi:hypothetical protein
MSRSANHWLRQAAQARNVAEGLKDPEARRAMLGVAAEYEALARYADAMAKAGPPIGKGGKKPA